MSDMSCQSFIDKIKIVKVLSNYVFLVERNGHIEIMKIIVSGKNGNHPWRRIKGIMDYFTDKELLDRVLHNYKVFEDVGYGQVLYHHFCTMKDGQEALILFLEYLPHMATEELIEEYSDEIEEAIKNLHKMGIYHGDLHAANIGFDKDMRPIFIDLDTVFYDSDIQKNKIPELWAEKGFDMTVDELIEYEEEENYKII